MLGEDQLVFMCIHYTCLYIIGRVSKSKLDKDDCACNLQRSVPREKLVKVWEKLSKREEEAIVTQVSDFK